VFVQEDQVVRILPEEGQGIVTVGDGVDVVPPLLEEEEMGPQKVDLVVHPEDALGWS